MPIRIIYVIPFFLMCSCAQVGVLSGGAKDDRAPIVRESDPVAGATRVRPQRITLKFDEFIELVNPLETFRLEPADAKLGVKLNKKEIIITLNGTLKENTTYSLCIDGGVKDVTEGNDSIYRLAFSTGNFLDSLKQHYLIGDVYTKKLIPGASVGLYQTYNSPKPRYITKSNKEGIAHLENLPTDSFFIKVFLDVNKNGTVDPFEPQDAFFSANLPQNDSMAMLLSKPRNSKRALNFKVKAPGLLIGHVPEEIGLENLLLNGEKAAVIRLARDSVALNLSGINPGPLRLTSPYDTLDLLYLERDRKIPLKAEISAIVLGNPVNIQWNGFLSNKIKTDKIHILRADSSEVKVDSFLVENNNLQIFSNFWGRGKLKVIFDSEACSMQLGEKNQPQTLELNYLAPSELGTLMVQFPEELKSHLVFLEKDGKVIQSKRYGNQNPARKDIFRQLIPGEYHVLVVEDLNGNGYWDTFRPEIPEPAEPVKRYAKIPKVRANWEVEVTLE